MAICGREVDLIDTAASDRHREDTTTNLANITVEVGSIKHLRPAFSEVPNITETS